MEDEVFGSYCESIRRCRPRDWFSLKVVSGKSVQLSLDDLSLNSSVVVITAVGHGSVSPKVTPMTIDVAGVRELGIVRIYPSTPVVLEGLRSDAVGRYPLGLAHHL
ncbi:unnamed protein product [Cyberlindnera jadinii]|uniref:Uncharacterized protein n=1 Tax=Cyberlindnera jadinii (strain ATCC 18201 / CBS 1600 / BCRC 20928 / JCM 3617 / NBRC 0987 / NRRL Y-1542) TaxID=983966 RepID=A0A0H5C2L1_CYBJN|nr:unnamed protein product [Cyberlindnera jadinii]